MDIWNISMNFTESLQILTEGFSFLLLEKLHVAGPAGLLVAIGEGTDVLRWRKEGSFPERRIASMLIQRMKMNQPVRGREGSTVRSQGNLCKYLRRAYPFFCWRSCRSLGLPGSWWPQVPMTSRWPLPTLEHVWANGGL